MKKVIITIVLAMLLVLLLGCPPEPPPPAPETCTILFDNWTGYSINCYANDDYQGTMTPWGSFYAYDINAGNVTLYGISTGGTVYWGPATYQINANTTFRWMLYE